MAKEDIDGEFRNMSSLTVSDRAVMENRLHTALDTMAAKMDGVIDELFSTK